MAKTATIVMQVTAAGTALSKTNTYTGDAIDSRDLAIPDSTTDQVVNQAIDLSQIKMLYMNSTQALTVETNSGSSPTDTISLLANQPLIWHPNDYNPNLLTADVTALYLTNASGTAATFTLELVHDATP